MTAAARLADLGKRIDTAIQRHGFTEREFLVRHIRRSIEACGTVRLQLTVSKDVSKWVASEWRPA